MFIRLLCFVLAFGTVRTTNDFESGARCKRQITQSSGCSLTPEATEGPYYWNSTIRQNITEGKPGIPLRLSIAVIDTNNCSPLVNALVDLWHCDAVGIYSHYIAASQGMSGAGNDNQTFFRGLVFTNSLGVAVFDTIYPGWYMGRATHIHVKVHVGANMTSNTSGTYSDGHVSHTGQLFFNDTLTDSVALISPYSTHNITRLPNSGDGIYASANGSVTLVKIIQNSGTNYTGTVTLGVNSSAIPPVTNGGEMGPGMGPMPPNMNAFSTPTNSLSTTQTLTNTMVSITTTTSTAAGGVNLVSFTPIFILIFAFLLLL